LVVSSVSVIEVTKPGNNGRDTTGNAIQWGDRGADSPNGDFNGTTTDNVDFVRVHVGAATGIVVVFTVVENNSPGGPTDHHIDRPEHAPIVNQSLQQQQQ
jgi:hypothetical protein